MKAKLAGALAVMVLRNVTAICSRQNQPRDSGKRRTTHPKIQNAHFYRAKRGLPKVECHKAMKTLKCGILNIHHGNRVPIVVRGRESRLHGEGEQ